MENLKSLPSLTVFSTAETFCCLVFPPKRKSCPKRQKVNKNRPPHFLVLFQFYLFFFQFY